MFSCIPGKNKTVKGAFVVSFMGSVEIVRGAEAPRSVAIGDELKEGDRVITGGSSFLVFQIADTATARVQPDSDVTLANIADPSNINLNLTNGGVLNRVSRLGKNSSYKITTPTVVASVRGTVFSTYYTEGTNTVAVKNGNVDVSVKERAESASLKEGTTAVYRDALTERPIEEAESILLENMTSLPAAFNLLDRAESDRVNQEIIDKDKEVNSRIQSRAVPKTLNEIKEKYERIDVITLYSGKVVRGVILERGAYYKVLTTSGQVNIPAKQVRNTKVVR